jgi:hypothetical protein
MNYEITTQPHVLLEKTAIITPDVNTAAAIIQNWTDVLVHDESHVLIISFLGGHAGLEMSKKAPFWF